MFGAPCTGKEDVKVELQKQGLEFCDMDDLIFPKYEQEFRECEFNMDKFAKAFPLILADIRREWVSKENIKVAFIWPSWLDYLPTDSVIAFALYVKDNNFWLQQVASHDDPDLITRIKEKDTLEWISARGGISIAYMTCVCRAADVFDMMKSTMIAMALIYANS